MKYQLTVLGVIFYLFSVAQHATEVTTTGADVRVAIFGESVGAHNGTGNEVGVLGSSTGTGDGWNLGVQGTAAGQNGEQIGVYGFGGKTGVYGSANNNGTNIGIFGQIFGMTTSLSRIAILGDASTGTVGPGGVLLAGQFNGNVDVTGALSQGSDRKLKKNISDYNGNLADISKLRVTEYFYKSDTYKSFPSKKQIGFIAQELNKVFPHLVGESVENRKLGESEESYLENFENKKYLTVNYIGLIPILTKGIQELAKTNDTYKAQLLSQEKRISDLEAQLELLLLQFDKANK